MVLIKKGGLGFSRPHLSNTGPFQFLLRYDIIEGWQICLGKQHLNMSASNAALTRQPRATNKKDHLALEEGTDSPLRPPGKSDLIKPQDYSRCFAAYYTIFCHEKIVGEIIGGLQSGTPHTNYGK